MTGAKRPSALQIDVVRLPPESSHLPDAPNIGLSIVADRTAASRASGGYLNVLRLDLVARYPDGSESAPFPYDIASRAALDVVVMAAYYGDHGAPNVFLRSAIRPPCALRSVPPAHDGRLWELPAGLVDPGEEPLAAAERELGEELGFFGTGPALFPLGEWMFPAPGMIAERHIFFAVEVDPATRGTPLEDGSALERAALVTAMPVADAIEECRRGIIRDAKTELALRRLAEFLP
ncbi:MAG: NUDIX hydrolase [Polyangiaceae bacterium]|jgi:ADP-ribose pyrophosphatase